jgi:hypothetical protein
LRASKLANLPFLLYPKRSNGRLVIDRFFSEVGVTPQVLMEADDTEAIKGKTVFVTTEGYHPYAAHRIIWKKSRFQLLFSSYLKLNAKNSL